jgi:hypothetical protein
MYRPNAAIIRQIQFLEVGMDRYKVLEQVHGPQYVGNITIQHDLHSANCAGGYVVFFC